MDNLGAAIQASSNNTFVAAITGVSTAAIGYGQLGQNQDASGTGTAGFSANRIAVYGFSSGAVPALRGLSTNGYGLFVSGNIRLTGGIQALQQACAYQLRCKWEYDLNKG